MNESYCPIHDKELNNLMDKYKFEKSGKYTHYLGNTAIWTGNYPYASGIDNLKSRPSRLTLARMGKRIIQDTISTKSLK